MSSFRRFPAEHPLPFFVLQADYIRRFFFILFIAGGCYPPLFLLFQADCIRRSLFAISLFFMFMSFGRLFAAQRGFIGFFLIKIAKNIIFSLPEICIYQKFFVPLHPICKKYRLLANYQSYPHPLLVVRASRGHPRPY